MSLPKNNQNIITEKTFMLPPKLSNKNILYTCLKFLNKKVKNPISFDNIKDTKKCNHPCTVVTLINDVYYCKLCNEFLVTYI